MITHIALHVESVRQATRFYARLFDLQLLQGDDSREAEHPTPRREPAREPAAEGEAVIDRCILGRGGFRLALGDDAPENAGSGRVAHIGVQLLDPDVEGLRERAISLGCRILRRDDLSLLLEDVYGICWHVSPDGRDGTERSGTTEP